MRFLREPAHSNRDIGHNIEGIFADKPIIGTLLTKATRILHRLLVQLFDDIDSGGVLGNALLLFLLFVKGGIVCFLYSRDGSGVLTDLLCSSPVIVQVPGIGRSCDEQCHQQQSYNSCTCLSAYLCCLLTSLANFRYLPVSPAFSISLQKCRMPSTVSSP